ncbi:hypothetical protein M8C21_009988, partial [Ambrosia artemisiifolia]
GNSYNHSTGTDSGVPPLTATRLLFLAREQPKPHNQSKAHLRVVRGETVMLGFRVGGGGCSVREGHRAAHGDSPLKGGRKKQGFTAASHLSRRLYLNCKFEALLP